ncbi:unnamed protein product [Sphacelaria rigidula]
MICAHMRNAGHRGVAATLLRLQEVCVWQGVEIRVREFVRQCLHCADSSAGNAVPRPVGETVHWTTPNEVVQYDFLYVGESGPLAPQRLSEDAGFRYILAFMDDLGNFVALEPVAVCTAELTAASFAELVQNFGGAPCVGE